MGGLWRALGNVQLRHLAQIHFKVAIVVWMVVLALYTPDLSSAALGAVVLVVVGVTIVGALTAIFGLILSTGHGLSARRGLGIELAGLWCMAFGPFAYFITQIFIASTLPDGWNLRGAFICILWSLFAAVVARAAVVGHRFRLVLRTTHVAE